MSEPEVRLDRNDIENLLRRLGEKADAEGIRIQMFLVGGSAMALAYNTERITGDLDGVFEPKSRVYELARQVADESDIEIGDDWLNDGVKGFLPGPDQDARGVLNDIPGLAVQVASPRYLFILKAMSAREADEADLRTLYPLSGFADAEEALGAIEAAYPTLPIKPNVQYLVESVAQDNQQSVAAESETPKRRWWQRRPQAGGKIWVPPHTHNGK